MDPKYKIIKNPEYLKCQSVCTGQNYGVSVASAENCAIRVATFLC